MVIKTWNDIPKEMKGAILNLFLLVKLKSLLIVPLEYLQNILKYLAVPILLQIS